MDDPQFCYGAVYFRKSGPPRQDWERDYAQAAADGYNVFRHWFIWGAIEIAPGVYDWQDYDKQLELAQKYGIKTVIAEITHGLPQWLIATRPHLLPIRAQGGPAQPEMGVSCGTGGFFTGLCLDNPEAKQLVGGFLRALANRYKGHPALLGYDVANECYKPPDICYCAHTLNEYRQWLKNRYGSIEALNQDWKTYSYTSFDQITPPPAPAFFADSACWLAFRRENHLKQIQWKIDTLRSVDEQAMITAHGMAATFSEYSHTCCDDWAAAGKVSVYGATWVQCRKGNEPWKQLAALDLTRAAGGGKPFWHTEAQGGPLWLQPGLAGRSRQDGRIPDETDLRIWNLMSMASGAKGIFYTRFRPLLDGPLFGAFAPYAEDGSPTPRSQMAAQLAHWAGAAPQRALMQAQPVQGDIAIVFVPESEAASYLLTPYGNPHWYPRAMWGAWRGFHDGGIRADFVHIDQLDSVQLAYLPYPISLSPQHKKQLCQWVQQGGRLISEGCPGYFDEGLRVDLPGAKALLEQIFGARQNTVEFAPDLAEQTGARLLEQTVACGGYLQSYWVQGGQLKGTLGNEAFAVQHQSGKGKALLVGTSLAIGYTARETGDPQPFKAAFQAMGGQTRFYISDTSVVVRLHGQKSRTFLWLLNPTRQHRKVTIHFQTPVAYGQMFWKGGEVSEQAAGRLTATLQPRDGVVIELYET